MRGRSPLAVIFLTVFIDLVGFGIVIPLIPFYAEAAGGSGAVVGLLFASYSVAQFLFVPLWGRLSDRVGRRPVILVSLVGTGLSFLLFALAHDALLWLFVSRFAAGAFGGSIATAQAYIGDVTDAEGRAKGMGLVGAAFGLGFILGPGIGGLLSAAGPFWPPAAAGFMALANAVLAAVVLPESRPAKERAPAGPKPKWFASAGLAAAGRDRPLGALYLVSFLAVFAFSNFETTFALLLQENLAYDRSQAAWLFVYIGVLSATIQGGLFGRLTARFGPRNLVVAGTVLVAAGLFVLPEVGSLGPLLVVTAVVAVGTAVNRPSINTLVSFRAGPERQGAYLGTGASLASLARVLGPAAAGFLWDAGHVVPYWVAAGVMAVAGLVAVRLLPRGPGASREAAPPDPAPEAPPPGPPGRPAAASAGDGADPPPLV